MLTCIACPKTQRKLAGALARFHEPPADDELDVDALTLQIKDIALKAAGKRRRCNPCSAGSAPPRRRHHPYYAACAGARTAGFCYAYRRAEAYRKGDLDVDRQEKRAAPSGVKVADGDDDGDGKEWVANVEPGVLITFLPSPLGGGNDIKKIRFSREMFNPSQAQQWWDRNYDRVMELYNVRSYSHEASLKHPSPIASSEDDQSSKEEAPVTPPLAGERPPAEGGGSSSDSRSRQSARIADRIDGAMPISSSGDEMERADDLSVSASDASDQESTEWVEEDEPGVYITVAALLGGVRELRRVRFSCERFSEMQARQWWEDNRERIHRTYLS